jgi:hypothetical protein
LPRRPWGTTCTFHDGGDSACEEGNPKNHNGDVQTYGATARELIPVVTEMRAYHGEKFADEKQSTIFFPLGRLVVAIDCFRLFVLPFCANNARQCKI